MSGGKTEGYFDSLPGDTAIFVAAANEVNGRWLPLGLGWMLPCERWDSIDDGGMTIPKLVEMKEQEQLISGVPIPFCPEMVQYVKKQVGEEFAMRQLAHDIGGELSAVLELCEALTCKNIGIATHQEAPVSLNKKRIKKGKLPFYETKMLVVETSSTSAAGEKRTNSSHSSPRQHLRRGHIRRLPIGNIWVNSCVVGDSSKGIINKSYTVK